MFPNSIVIDDINSPIDAKNYISAMDVVIAARMHATIAGVSSGVATIPVAYSRKFRGLYDSIGYDYVLDLKALDTYQAVEQTMGWIDNYKKLTESAMQSKENVDKKLDAFINDLISDFKAI